jgi:transketolase
MINNQQSKKLNCFSNKGHAAPILYAAWAEAGLFPVEKLMTLRKMDSELDGHPTPNLVFVDVATGSLGQGLSCAVGMAYTAKHFDKSDYRVFCLCGDGESAEGSVWEAMAFASFYKLDNLVNIIDVNRLGQSEATMYQHNMDLYKRRVEAFGWKAIIVDGHDIRALVAALNVARETKDMPTCILAQTYKGRNMPGIEDNLNWHGKPLGKNGDESIKHIESLIKNKNKLAHELVSIKKPELKLAALKLDTYKLSKQPNYKIGEQVAMIFVQNSEFYCIYQTHAQTLI